MSRGPRRATLTVEQLKPVVGRDERHIRRWLKAGHLDGHPVETCLGYSGNPRARPGWLVVVESLRPDHREAALALYPHLREPVAAELPVPAEKVRRKRSDKNKARVVISRAVDRGLTAGGVDRDGLVAFRDCLDGKTLFVWGDGTIGWETVRVAVRPDLEAKARSLGFRGSDAERRAIVDAIPRHVIERTMAKGKVRFNSRKNAKLANDKAPHIRRDWNLVPPGAVAIRDDSIGDLMFVDEEDGGDRTFPMVAEVDGGSDFYTVYPLAVPRGRDVTMADNALGFALARLEHGTVPGWVYCDRGPVNGYMDLPLVEDLLRAAWPDEALGLDPSRLPPRRVVRTLTGRAASKGGGESVFRVLKDAMRDLPGMRFGRWSTQPTKTLRKPIKAVLTLSETLAALQERLDYINHRPMARHGGRSRAEVFALRPRHDIDITDMQVAISRERLVTVHQGGFRLDNRRYAADALADRPWLKKVLTYTPLFGDPRRVALRDPIERGRPFIGTARAEGSRHPLDAAGALESARRRKLHVAAIDELAAQAIPVDISRNLGIATAERRAAVARDAPPTPEAERISLNGAFGDAAEDRRRLNAEGPAAAPLPEPEDDWFALRLARLKEETGS